MSRRKPEPRIAVHRSRNNAKRKLVAAVPSAASREEMSARVRYGPYSKHKSNPAAYGLAPYAGQDEERTYCDAHAGFRRRDFPRIPALLRRGVMLGLWSEQSDDDVPRLLWTLDENGWIYELRITNVGLHEYHGYPVLPDDAFARYVLVRARAVAFAEDDTLFDQDPGTRSAIANAEAFYR